MPYNGSGNFTRLYDWTTDRDGGVDILASKMDDEFDGMATALSTAICKDGQTTVTANIPFNSNKLTGVAAGTAATDAARVEQIQKLTVGWAVAGGTADVITASFTPTLTAIAAGSILRVRASAANTSTTPTFNPDALGAETITKNGGQALVAGDIFGAAHELLLQKKTTGYELLNPGVTITAFARTVLDDTTAGAARTTLGVGAEQDAAWTSAQTVTLATAGNNLSLITTDAGAVGSKLRLHHSSASPAVSDVIATLLFDGKDSGAADQNYANIKVQVTDPTAATEDAKVIIEVAAGGAVSSKMEIGPGVQVGAPTGGIPATGSINAAADYLYNNAPLPRGLAAAADMETATSTVLAVTPGLQHSHPGHPKAWGYITVSGGVPTLQTDSGITSVADGGAGRFAYTLDTAFSTANYAAIPTSSQDQGVSVRFHGMDENATAPSTTVWPFAAISSAGAYVDPLECGVSFFGDQ